MSEEYQTHVSGKKKDDVAQMVKLIKESPIVGVVDVENLPALQLNRMRAQLRGKVTVLMSKKRLMRIALKECVKNKDGIEQLDEYLRGMPAFIFTEESPFKLFKTLKKSKSNAPIKGGQTAPNDIVVPAGGTSFAPGPIIGELGSFGIQSGIEGGKIAIKADKVVAKEGDVVSQKLAGILTRLGVEPMEIGLNLTALWENGAILRKDVLDVDEDAYIKNIQTAASWAFNLAVNAGYPTSETIMPMLQKAHRDAYALAIAQDVMTEDTKELILAKAEAQAKALKEKIPDAPAASESAPAEESKEESKEQTADNSVQNTESETAPEGETKEE